MLWILVVDMAMDGWMDALGRMSAVCRVRDLSSSSAPLIGLFDQLQWWTLLRLCFPLAGVSGHCALGYIIEAASCYQSSVYFPIFLPPSSSRQSPNRHVFKRLGKVIGLGRLIMYRSTIRP